MKNLRKTFQLINKTHSHILIFETSRSINKTPKANLQYGL